MAINQSKARKDYYRDQHVRARIAQFVGTNRTAAACADEGIFARQGQVNGSVMLKIGN
jgi:hypothetical protein